MQTQRLPLALIYPRDGARSVRADRVGPLAESINTLGLRTPITVRAVKKIRDGSPADAYEIVCGQHRYHAALKLQWTEIECVVTDDDALHTELWEIDENLVRAELSAAEQAYYLKRRKELWSALNPQDTDNKQNLGGKSFSTKPQWEKGFAGEVEEKTNRTKQSINQSIRRAEKLGDDSIEKVRGTSLDKGVELDALVKLPPKQREKLIDRAAAGEKVSAKAALQEKQAKAAERQGKDEPPPLKPQAEAAPKREATPFTDDEIDQLRELDNDGIGEVLEKLHDLGWAGARRALSSVGVPA